MRLAHFLCLQCTGLPCTIPRFSRIGIVIPTALLQATIFWMGAEKILYARVVAYPHPSAVPIFEGLYYIEERYL